uniref:Uncharacterized protein n=1 Tax=Hydrodictyon reticulatum TaxID=3107 RepID=A0A1W5RMW7_HYDRE|nr:hypothetical protein [Hydrodictyon reticulatum]AQU64544.1 hypothetical protein [Hydrodictyon reticulatum]
MSFLTCSRFFASLLLGFFAFRLCRTAFRLCQTTSLLWLRLRRSRCRCLRFGFGRADAFASLRLRRSRCLRFASAKPPLLRIGSAEAEGRRKEASASSLLLLCFFAFQLCRTASLLRLRRRHQLRRSRSGRAKEGNIGFFASPSLLLRFSALLNRFFASASAQASAPPKPKRAEGRAKEKGEAKKQRMKQMQSKEGSKAKEAK